MQRKPNYNFERKERERLKAAKKAEKLAARKTDRDLAKDALPAALVAPGSEPDASDQ